MDQIQFLALYFDAPMQSYGVESRFDRRASLPWPSRSAVTGILCAAMGIDRADRTFLANMAKLDLETFVLKRDNKRSLSRMIDFHTVGGGYDNKSETIHIPRTADEKGRRTVVSYREFLLDARFGVLVSGDNDLIGKFHAALKNPVWGIWFGRKCCVPASPIAQGIYVSKNDAVQILCKRAGCQSPQLRIRETDSYSEGSDSFNDVPVTFERHCRGMGEEFSSRRIIVEYLDQ
ncbi:MAG: type I-E CRISPR-associated protein Cas5/CasD [Planctomycetia bacterium]|nr:type I-E CRISPR-associated protein Cas5/CasD [Planctomycetia bacterium]